MASSWKSQAHFSWGHFTSKTACHTNKSAGSVYLASLIFSVDSVLLYSREIRDIHILKVDSRCQIFMRTTIHYAMKALWQHWLWSFHFKVQVFCEGHKIFEVIFHLVLTLLSDVKSKWKITPTLGIHPVLVYSQVPIKRVGPNKRVGWIF